MKRLTNIQTYYKKDVSQYKSSFFQRNFAVVICDIDKNITHSIQGKAFTKKLLGHNMTYDTNNKPTTKGQVLTQRLDTVLTHGHKGDSTTNASKEVYPRDLNGTSRQQHAATFCEETDVPVVCLTTNQKYTNFANSTQMAKNIKDLVKQDTLKGIANKKICKNNTNTKIPKNIKNTKVSKGTTTNKISKNGIMTTTNDPNQAPGNTVI